MNVGGGEVDIVICSVTPVTLGYHVNIGSEYQQCEEC